MPLINRCGGGGGIPQLSEQVETLSVTPGVLSANLSWTAPAQDQNNSFVGTRIVRKIDSCPTSPTDGTVIYEGTAFSYTDTGLTLGTTYYYRAFAYNSKGKFQNSMRAVNLTAISSIALAGLAEGSLVGIMEGDTLVPFYVAKHNYESDYNTNRTLLVRREFFAGTADQNRWSRYSTPSGAYSENNISSTLVDIYFPTIDSTYRTKIGSTTIKNSVAGNKNVSVSTANLPVFAISAYELGYGGSSAYSDGTALSAEMIALLTSFDMINGDTWSAQACWTRTLIKSGTSIRILSCKGSDGSFITTWDGDTSLPIRPCITLSGAEQLSPSPNSDGIYTLV